MSDMGRFRTVRTVHNRVDPPQSVSVWGLGRGHYEKNRPTTVSGDVSRNTESRGYDRLKRDIRPRSESISASGILIIGLRLWVFGPQNGANTGESTALSHPTVSATTARLGPTLDRITARTSPLPPNSPPNRRLVLFALGALDASLREKTPIMNLLSHPTERV